MISSIMEFVSGGALSLVSLLLSLFPVVDVSSLPIAVPDWISDSLGLINYFVPIGTMITIITVWASAILAVNASRVLTRIIKSVK